MRIMKLLKFIMPILILLQMIFIPITVNAGFFDDVLSEGDAFVSEGKSSGGDDIVDNFDFSNNVNDIYVTIFIIAIVVAVIVAGILGIQFIIASAEDKAKVKEAMIPYVIGCVVAFGSYGIWKAVVLILS